jgi:hypothetical protein
MPTAKPEPNAEYQCRALFLGMGAGEADGGRRGWWGQARVVGAGETGGGRRSWRGQARPMGAIRHWPHARARQHQTLGKPPGQIPSQQEHIQLRIFSHEIIGFFAVEYVLGSNEPSMQGWYHQVQLEGYEILCLNEYLRGNRRCTWEYTWRCTWEYMPRCTLEYLESLLWNIQSSWLGECN